MYSKLIIWTLVSFCTGFYKQETYPPEKDILSLSLNFPSGLVHKPRGSSKHRVTALPILSFSPSSVPHSFRLNNAPHSDLHHLRSKAASTDQKDRGGCYLRLYLDSYAPASQPPSIVTSQILLGTPIPCRPLGFGGVLLSR